MVRPLIAAVFALALVANGRPAAAQDSLQDPYGSPKNQPAKKPAGDKVLDPYGSPKQPPPAKPGNDKVLDPYGTAKKPPPAKTISVPRKASPIDNAVAAALLDRANILFAAKDFANARQLYIESLVRSPKGPSATQALDMLKQSNTKLGNKDVYSGAPTVVRPAGTAKPLDPYGTGTDPVVKKPDKPLDPYGTGKIKTPDNTDPLDPYGTGKVAKPDPATPKDDPNADRQARNLLMGWSGMLGLGVGLAIAGPEDDNGDVSGGAVVAGILGAGATVGLSWYLTRKRKLTAGQSSAIMSAGTWGAYNIGLFADTLKTQGTTANDVMIGVALGGVLGVAAGAAYALKEKPSVDDVAVMNSFGAYGTTAGLMLGVLMDPPESEAYNVNAILGNLGGLAVGWWAAKKLDVSRSRMLRVDLGAALGVAGTWALFYPLISDDAERSDEQVTGLVSVLGMAGGAYAAWYLTRKMDKKKESLVKDGVASPYPSLLRRSSAGTWTTGVPIPRPMSTALAPKTRGRSMGIDLAGGWF